MPIEHKVRSFDLKATEDEGGGGGIEGVGAVFLNLDAAGDIIAPGAFKASIDAFLQDGFVGGLNHDWDKPIGHPTEAGETDKGLRFKAVFDDSDDARNVRAKMKVNPITGRATIRKLSIGFTVTDAQAFKSTDDVRSYWKTMNYEPDVADLDRLMAFYTPKVNPKTGKPVTPGVRLLKAIKLFEVSPVAVPANDRAEIIAAKGQYLGDVEEMAAFAVLGRLHDLLCWALYSIVMDDRIAVAERMTMVGEAVDEFRDVLLRLIGPILESADAGDGESASYEAASAALETMSKQFRERFGLPASEVGVKDGAGSAPAFADHSRQVVSAVGEFASRALARTEVRKKSGRELSAANRQALQSVLDGLSGHIEAIRTLLERTAPADAESPDATEEGKAAPANHDAEFLVRHRHLQLQAMLRGVASGS
jgi:HK97 family phage prohead protease